MEGSAPRTALVTGASSGIGLAISRMLCEEGFSVTAVARRPERLVAAVDELRSLGLVEIGVREDRADRVLGAKRGTPVFAR